MKDHLTRSRLCQLLAGVLVVLTAPLSAQELKHRMTLQGHTDDVMSLAFSPDGKSLASGSSDNTARIWNVATGEQTTTLKAGAHMWCTVAFSPDGKRLASGAGGNKIKLWDIATGKSTNLLERNDEYRSPTIVFSPDGKMLVSGGKCVNDMTIWDAVEGRKLATLKGEGGHGTRAMAFSADAKSLLSMDYRGGLKLWDVNTGKLSQAIKSNDYAPVAVFSPDRKILATSSRDKEIRLRDVATGKDLANFRGHTDDILSLVFSPDGKTLASGSRDKTIKLWDTATGKERTTLSGHTDDVMVVVFGPDGRTLASGSKDKSIRLWEMAKEK